MNKFQALAADLSRVAVHLALFAAAVVLILAAMVALFYFLALVTLLRGGFVYARHAPLSGATSRIKAHNHLPTAVSTLKAGIMPFPRPAAHGPRDRCATKKQPNAASSEAVAIRAADDSNGGNPSS